MKKEVVIFGTGGHAKVVYDILVQSPLYTPVAFLSLDLGLKSFLGLPHYQQDDFPKLNFKSGIIAIGDNWVRSKLVELILKNSHGFEFISAIHPSSVIGTESIIGKGTVVMANTVINPYSQVGDHVIVNTASSIDHDCLIGNFASIAPGVILGGNVKVGDFTAISLGANVIHGKKIGTHTIVGAGSLVIKDIEDHVVVFGSPCKFIRKRAVGEKYL